MRWVALGLMVIVLALQVPLWLGDGSYREVRRLRESVRTLNEEVSGLRDRNLALEAEVGDLRRGFDAIEERARSELGLIRDGESFVQMLPPLEEEAD